MRRRGAPAPDRIESGTSVVTIDRVTGIVTKLIRVHGQHGIVANEARWLGELSCWAGLHVPVLIDWDRGRGEWIRTHYCGERVAYTTAPKNWEAQMAMILQALRDVGCSHNDIKPTDILVSDGRVFLIDFGWATKIGDSLPSGWPLGSIGGRFRRDKRGVVPIAYDDAFSFERSMKSVMRRA